MTKLSLWAAESGLLLQRQQINRIKGQCADLIALAVIGFSDKEWRINEHK